MEQAAVVELSLPLVREPGGSGPGSLPAPDWPVWQFWQKPEGPTVSGAELSPKKNNTNNNKSTHSPPIGPNRDDCAGPARPIIPCH